MRLLQNIHDKDFDYIKTIIKEKIKNYFKNNNYHSIENLKQAKGFFKQFIILVAIDFYADDKIWDYGSFIAEDNKCKECGGYEKICCDQHVCKGWLECFEDYCVNPFEKDETTSVSICEKAE